jgi:hypothetical protein
MAVITEALLGWADFWYRPGAWLTLELIPQAFLRANGVHMLAAVAVGMLEFRAFAEISKEGWKQIVVSCLSTFPAFPRALGKI